MIELSIIIVNYKTREFLKRLLLSIRMYLKDNINYEIIILDNASNDGSVEMIKREFPDVKLIESEKNLGFGKANNFAFQISGGEIILFLNPDTLLIPNNEFIKILQKFKNDRNIGIIGGRVFDAQMKQVSSYGHDPTPFTLLLHFTILGKVLARLYPPLRKYRLNNYYGKEYELEKPVHQVNGCCIFVRREMINQIGIFDEQFFMYLEETDLCKRARDAGWKVMYVPLRTVIHFGQESAKQDAVQISKQFISSLRIFYQKHYPKKIKQLNLILMLGIVKPKVKKN